MDAHLGDEVRGLLDDLFTAPDEQKVRADSGQAAEEKIAAAASRRTGKFRIIATPVWMAAVIFPAIAAFREKLLTLRTAPFAERLRLLDNGESDLHCGDVEVGGPLPAFLRRKRFLDLTAGIAADEGHPLLEDKPGPADLAAWPWI